MNIPGFTAEASLDRASEHYQMTSVLGPEPNDTTILPAQFFTPNPDGPDGIPIPGRPDIPTIPGPRCFRVCTWECFPTPWGRRCFPWCYWICI